MTTNTAIWGAGKPQSNGVFAAILRTAERLSQARAKRRTARALAELDDYALLDIGVDPRAVRRSHQTIADWVVQSHSGTARLVFVGR